MFIVHSPDQLLRAVRTELSGGELVPPFECPERIAFVLERARATGFGSVIAPTDHGLDPILKVHDAGYVRFLETVWAEWVATGARGEAIPINWPARRMSQRVPDHVRGKLGYYALAADSSISDGTWQAARASADVALTATDRVIAGDRAAFGLCRPPGHHAARDLFGGYCFLNNAAIAAEALRDRGAAKVAVLDVDFHHGNGTQDIFWERGDVMYLSIHGDPVEAFPYFLGFADETGAGAGEGANVNLPLPRGSSFDAWGAALDHALARIRSFGAEALVISLGVDAYEGDPISFFRLKSADFLTVGARIAGAGLPTVFLMEGGYAVEEIGVNVVNVLSGFENT